MDHPLRRSRLAARLPDLEVEALLSTRLPNVRYLTGFTGSNGQVLVSGGDAVFFTDGRYTEQSRREVPDLRRETYMLDFPKTFGEACRELGVSRIGFEAGGVTYRFYEQLAAVEGLELVPVGDEVERLRWVKEPEEIDLVSEAQRITDEAFERLLAKLVEGISEKEAALELEWAMRQAGADGLAFDSIVAFGESAAEPHHDPSDRTLRRGDVIKVDCGALYRGYHSDMTRTVALGDPPAELAEIHGIVLSAQQAGIDAVRAGILGRDADRAARQVIEEAGHGEAFSHSLGHGVGLEIHEGPAFRSSSEDEIPAGAVVTVEPGIYLPGIGGVRIEDMVEVTTDGCRVLPSTARELVIL